MILVLGASGTVGSAVVNELRKLNADFAAAFRKPQLVEESNASGIHAELVDQSDKSAMQDTFRRYEKIFLLSAVAPDSVKLEGNAVEAAAEAGVKHIVKLSVIGADRLNYIFGAAHREVEQKIKASGIPHTILRPNGFMQNIIGQAESIKSTGSFYLPLENARVSEIDVRDIARTAAAALTQTGHEGKAYELTGSQALTAGEHAEILSDALGRKVQYISPSDDQWGQALLGAGMPSWNVEVLIDLHRLYRTGQASMISPHVEEVTGVRPMTYQEFARDHASAFQ